MFKTKFEYIVACTNCPHGSLVDNMPTCALAGVIKFWDPAATCPDNRWATTFLAPFIPPPETPAQIERKGLQAIWQAAKNVVDKVAGAAESLSSGQADAATVAKRKESCAACPARVRGVDGFDYCNDCGCPADKWWWPISRLDSKLELKVLPCPRKRPGFSNEEKA